MTGVSENLESQIIRFCAPVIAGLKPAGMFSVSRTDYPYLNSEIRKLNSTLNGVGLFFFIVCRCSSRELLFVYNKKKIAKILQDKPVCSYLSKKGYKAHASVEKTVFQLQSNFSLKKDFPHEIGIFLGYPLEDVLGFEKNRGQNFKCCGCWKVYGNVSDAYRCFLSYANCTNSMMYLYSTGRKTFEELCRVA